MVDDRASGSRSRAQRQRLNWSPRRCLGLGSPNHGHQHGTRRDAIDPQVGVPGCPSGRILSRLMCDLCQRNRQSDLRWTNVTGSYAPSPRACLGAQPSNSTCLPSAEPSAERRPQSAHTDPYRHVAAAQPDHTAVGATLKATVRASCGSSEHRFVHATAHQPRSAGTQPHSL